MTHTAGPRLVVVPLTLALVATMASTASARTPVPSTLAWVVLASDRPSLTDGGSVYDSQVPSAARTAGSSTYDSQVPAAAR